MAVPIVLALLLAACSPSTQSTQNVLEGVTTLEPAVFGEPQDWTIPNIYHRAYPGSCDSVVVPVDPALSPCESDSALDAMVAVEADAFEQAGWTVSRYTGSGDSFSGRAMVAERNDQILKLSRFLSPETLAYRDFTGCEYSVHPSVSGAVVKF